MITVHEVGALGYGGVVTLTEWWDNKRIQESKIGPKDVFKKASFYSYLGIGLGATLISGLGKFPRYEKWFEKISTGFFYDIPRFSYNMYKTLTPASTSNAGSRAVAEAQRLLKQAPAAVNMNRSTSRSYQEEFKDAIMC